MSPFPSTRSAEPSLRRSFYVLHLDPILLVLLLGICALGLTVLYSASGHSVPTVVNQAERLVIGLVVMGLAAQAPPEIYRAGAPWFYGFAAFLCVLTLLLGDHAKGAQRWLDLGVLRFQPSELMKLAMPIMVAGFLHLFPLPPRPHVVGTTLLIIGGPVLLVMIQPDLGTSLLILASGGFALYLGGLSWKYIVGAGVLIGAAAPVLWARLHEYQQQRILTLLDPESDPLGAGYHIAQSKIAIGSGGPFGKGWLEGTQAKLDFLPESHTDFILAVFAEELGLAGVCLLLLLYLAVVARGLYIAARAQDSFQRLLAGALSMTFFVYVFINMGMVMGLLPVVGVPLPLMSYGGTSMVSLLAGFGILMSIHTHRKLLES
ncbi:rod shape-determining protein RodA [Panacagrimonas sp.]|uniref:rod shape-determining protein RodA n=2 Tax=Panacagrimonas sp. TaxID=2480088 RepID=UPI003B520B63